MKVVSVNVGLPRTISWRGRSIRTGIYKEPVAGPVAVASLNLDGDGQADLEVHGGVEKAVYAYPSEHYAFWRSELPRAELGWGAFGENLTTEGWLEDAVHIGDRFRVGTAELRVTQPRVPCFKLGIRFADAGMVKRFQRSGRSGFYLAVTREGRVAPGDPIRLLERDAQGLSVTELLRLTTTHREDRGLLERALRAPGLSESWRQDLEERRKKLGGRA